MTKDYYKILGVAEFESAEEIKKAYRKLARELHPDVAGNNSDTLKRFKEINEAYATLSDKNKKEEYDRARRFYNYAKKEDEVKENNYKETTNPNKTNKSFNFNEFFNKNYNKYKQTAKAPIRGKDIFSDIEISLTEALLGTVKTINVLQTTLCPKCKGHKFINGSICSKCNGTGEQAKYSKLTVKIPAGVKNKSKIRLAGEGESGKNGGCNGDLYLIINIKEPDIKNNSDINIYKTISITPFEAVLGTEITISTPNNEIKMKIPANTQNNQKFNLSGCGNVQNEKIGDMIITVEIKIPKNLTKEEISLYERLRDISSSNIRDIDYDR